VTTPVHRGVSFSVINYLIVHNRPQL